MSTPPGASQALGPLLEGRLLLVTGKGGTGKSTVASALAVLAATRGRRVLLAELDMSRPSLDPLFGIRTTATPAKVHDRLDVVNVLYGPALEHFIGSVVPVRAVVRRVLDNPAIQRFLDFTPGAREMVTLSRVLAYTQDYDLVVVDLPASGHAFSLLDVTRSALGLFRTGPMRERAERMRNVLQQDSTRVALVSLPEEMVVNETLETAERFANNGLFSRPPVVLLNRSTQPTLADAERTLLARLEQVPLPPHGAELAGAGSLSFREGAGPMPDPTGTINLKLTGGNTLLDRLVQMGLIPEDQSMGIRMMIGLFSRPGEGPDALDTELQFRDGGIYANGQRVR